MTTGHYRHEWDVLSVSISVLVEGVIGVITEQLIRWILKTDLPVDLQAHFPLHV